MPLLSWSTFGNLRLTNGSERGNRITSGSRNTQSTQSTTGTPYTDHTLLSTYQGRPFEPRLLVSSFRDLSLDKVGSFVSSTKTSAQSNIQFSRYQTKYFVLRSDNETDMEISFARGMWTALKGANKRLDNGYHRSDGNVIIFFSIVKRCVVPTLPSQSHIH